MSRPLRFSSRGIDLLRSALARFQPEAPGPGGTRGVHPDLSRYPTAPSFEPSPAPQRFAGSDQSIAEAHYLLQLSRPGAAAAPKAPLDVETESRVSAGCKALQACVDLNLGPESDLMTNLALIVSGLRWPQCSEAESYLTDGLRTIETNMNRFSPDGATKGSPKALHSMVWHMGETIAWMQSNNIEFPTDIIGTWSAWAHTLSQWLGGMDRLPLQATTTVAPGILWDLIAQAATWKVPAGTLPQSPSTSPQAWETWSWRDSQCAVAHRSTNGVNLRFWTGLGSPEGTQRLVAWDLPDGTVLQSKWDGTPTLSGVRSDTDAAQFLMEGPAATRRVQLQRARMLVHDTGLDTSQWTIGPSWTIEPHKTGWVGQRHNTAPQDKPQKLIIGTDPAWRWDIRRDETGTVLRGAGNPGSIRTIFELG